MRKKLIALLAIGGLVAVALVCLRWARKAPAGQKTTKIESVPETARAVG